MSEKRKEGTAVVVGALSVSHHCFLGVVVVVEVAGDAFSKASC